MKKISFIQPSRNNLKYLKWSYDALRKNVDKSHQICVADDFSNDGTYEWCKQKVIEDKNFAYIRNTGPTRLGHTILYDRLINEVATNDIVMIYHADMYACPDFDKHIDRIIKPGTVVSLTRIEPPLHPPGPEKIFENFGTEPEDFPEDKFLSWFEATKKGREGKITEGIFAPWAIYKSDFQSIGGHDPLYAPQSKEDSDIFNRFLLNGYKLIQTWDGCVYHMTCRGSRFNPTLTTVGKNSSEWEAQNYRSTKNFIRKWGSFVEHDAAMKPLIAPKYDVGFVVKNCDSKFLGTLEPWCSCIYIENQDLVQNYIEVEQKETKFDMKKRVFHINNPKTNKILIEFDCRELIANPQRFQLVADLPKILKDSGEVGQMEYDAFKFDIKDLTNYENNLINLGDSYYQQQLLL